MTKSPTATQRRVLALLSDGMPHTKEQIRACLHDDMGSLDNVKVFIYYLRRILPPGQAIICENTGKGTRYRHVRLLTSAD
jgi:hypothetical protein